MSQARLLLLLCASGLAMAQQVGRVFIDAPVSSLIVGEQAKFSATVRSTNGDLLPNAALAWRTNNTALAQVDAQGMVTAAGLGIVQITAQSGNTTANIAIQILPLRIDLDPTYKELMIGETLQFNATALDIKGKPIPNVSFNWEITGANGNQINAASMNRNTGTLTAIGIGLISVRARFGYGGGVGRIEWVWGAATVLIRPRPAYRLQRLLSTDEVRHSWQLRGGDSAEFNDAGQLAFLGDLDSLTRGLFIREGGVNLLLEASGGIGPDGGVVQIKGGSSLSINSRGEVLMASFSQPGSDMLALYTSSGRKTLLLSGFSLGELENINGLNVQRHSLNDLGDVLFSMNYRKPGSAINYNGLMRLVNRVLDPVVLSDAGLPGQQGAFSLSEFGMDNQGASYFVANFGATRILYRREAFGQPVKLLATGDPFAGSRIRNLRGLAISPAGDLGTALDLDDGSQRVVRIAGGQISSLAVQGLSQVWSGRNVAGLLLRCNGPQGDGVYRWQSGSSLTLLLATGRLAPNGEPITNFQNVTLTSRGELYSQLQTVETSFVLTRGPSTPTLLTQSRDQIAATASINFPFNRTLIPGLGSGPMLALLGDSGSIFELDGSNLIPRVLAGDRLPDGSTLQPGSPMGTAGGDVYFPSSGGIYRLKSGRIENVLSRSMELEPGVTANNPNLRAVNDQGSLVISVFTNQGDRFYLVENGRPVLLWRPDRPLPVPNLEVDSLGNFVIDQTGRVMAMASNRGTPAGLVVYAGGQWLVAAKRGDTGYSTIAVTGFGSLFAKGSSFFASFQMGGDSLVAEFHDNQWQPLVSSGMTTSDGNSLMGFNLFDVNSRGETLINSSALSVGTGGVLKPVHVSYLPTVEGDFLNSIQQAQIRDDGRIFFVARDNQSRFLLYVADPLQ